MKHLNRMKAIYIPTSDFENFLIVANRLPLDTKVINIVHAANQDGFIIQLHSGRWPVHNLLDVVELTERLMYKYRADLWRKMKQTMRRQR